MNFRLVPWRLRKCEHRCDAVSRATLPAVVSGRAYRALKKERAAGTSNARLLLLLAATNSVEGFDRS